MNSIPDATTVAIFGERLRHAGVIEELFELFDNHLRSQGYEARGGQIIDATLVPVPQPLGFCEAIEIAIVQSSWIMAQVPRLVEYKNTLDGERGKPRDPAG